MKSAILWAVRRICPAESVYTELLIWDCLSTSSRRKRTSNFPSGSHCACPMTMASARRLFHSAKSTWEISVGGGPTPPTNIARKRPLRVRSCSTISVMLCGSTDSPANGSTAMGIWLAPPPMISMVSCAWAAPARTIHAAKNVAVRFIRGKSIPPSFPSLVRPELQVEVALELLGPVGPGERRAFQDRPLDRLVVGLVAARFSEPRREHFAGRQLHDIEDRLRVSLNLGRQHDVELDLGADLVGVSGVDRRVRGRRELLQRFLALAGALERLLLLRELLPDPLGRVEPERRLLLFLLLRGLLFPLDRDVGLRRYLLELGLELQLWFDFRLRFDRGRRRFARRQLAPKFSYYSVRVPRLPAQAENQHGEEREVHHRRQHRRGDAVRFVRGDRVAHGEAGFTRRPTRLMFCRCSSSITFSTAS